jgi:hypothetical protein
VRLGAESAAVGRGTAAVPAGAAAEAAGGVAAAGGVDVAADVASPHAAHRQVNSRQLTAMRDLAPILTGCRGLIFDEKPLRSFREPDPLGHAAVGACRGCPCRSSHL